jgi:aminoglycoside phosphotransferase (APT) family kinase protein
VGRAEQVEAALAALVAKRLPGATGVASVRRLSGGASQETWSFDATTADGPLPLILRRRPKTLSAGPDTLALSLETEAVLIGLAAETGVPVPEVRCVLAPEDGLDSGYLMTRLAGETIPRRILRDEAFAQIRPKLARQCGRILAGIHAIPRERLPALPVSPGADQVERFRGLYDAYDHPHPVFELALRWLASRSCTATSATAT